MAATVSPELPYKLLGRSSPVVRATGSSPSNRNRNTNSHSGSNGGQIDQEDDSSAAARRGRSATLSVVTESGKASSPKSAPRRKVGIAPLSPLRLRVGAKRSLPATSSSNNRAKSPQFPHSPSPTIARTKVHHFRPEEVASELTLIDSQLLRKIRPVELENESWMKKDKKAELAPNVLAMVRASNDFAMLVPSEVLAEPTPQARARVISIFIKIASKCYFHHNYNSLKAILAGLQCTPVFRLKKTWKEVPAKKKKKFQLLSNLMSEDHNWSSYRLELQAKLDDNVPCIPFLGVLLTTIVQKSSAHSVKKTGGRRFSGVEDYTVMEAVTVRNRLEKIRKLSGNVRFSVFPGDDIPQSPTSSMASSYHRSRSLNHPPLTCINEQCRCTPVEERFSGGEYVSGGVCQYEEAIVDDDEDSDDEDDTGCSFRKRSSALNCSPKKTSPVTRLISRQDIPPSPSELKPPRIVDQPGYHSLLDGHKQSTEFTNLEEVSKNQFFQGEEKEGLSEGDGDSETSDEGDNVDQARTQKQPQGKKPVPAKQVKRGSTKSKKKAATRVTRKKSKVVKKGKTGSTSKASIRKIESRPSEVSSAVAPSFSVKGSGSGDRTSEFDVIWTIPSPNSRRLSPVHPRSRSEQSMHVNLPLGTVPISRSMECMMTALDTSDTITLSPKAPQRCHSNPAIYQQLSASSDEGAQGSEAERGEKRSNTSPDLKPPLTAATETATTSNKRSSLTVEKPRRRKSSVETVMEPPQRRRSRRRGSLVLQFAQATSDKSMHVPSLLGRYQVGSLACSSGITSIAELHELILHSPRNNEGTNYKLSYEIEPQ